MKKWKVGKFSVNKKIGRKEMDNEFDEFILLILFIYF